MINQKPASFFFIASFLFIGTTIFEVSPQTYNEYFGKKKNTFTYTESRVDNNIRITLSCKERTEICFLDSNYFCLKWIYKNNFNGADFTAVRSLDSIHISGIKNGSEFSNFIKVGNLPWLQFWEFGMGKMVSSGQSEMSFMSIDANKPSKIATFLAKKIETSNIKVGNHVEGANHFVVTIMGLP